MSGPVTPGKVHSFVLFVPSGTEPPPLPWAGELSPDNPKVPRWIRLDGECHGDGQVMPRELYALVVGAHRDPNDVIHTFMHEMPLELSCDEAVLVVHRYQQDDVELYTKNGAPLLAAAARSLTPAPSLVTTAIGESLVGKAAAELARKAGR